MKRLIKTLLMAVQYQGVHKQYVKPQRCQLVDSMSRFYTASAQIILVALVIVILNLMVCVPAQADGMAEVMNSPDSAVASLEEQVLQIIRDHPEVILESVEKYRQDQDRQRQQAQQELLDAIKQNPQPFIQKSPAKGAIYPKLLIIEFSDFQCPYCRDVHDTLNQFVANHMDEVSLVYKHYPLYRIHPQARAAAIAAWAANRQGKFWEYHDFLFDHQDELSDALYIQAAEELGLNVSQFERNRESPQAIATIQQDMQLAEQLGIGGTPFFVINGEAFSGVLQTDFLEEKLHP